MVTDAGVRSFSGWPGIICFTSATANWSDSSQPDGFQVLATCLGLATNIVVDSARTHLDFNCPIAFWVKYGPGGTVHLGFTSAHFALTEVDGTPGSGYVSMTSSVLASGGPDYGLPVQID